MDRMNCFGDEKEKVDDDSRDNTMFRNMKIPDTLEFTEPFDTSKTDAISSMFQDIRVPAPEEIGIPPKGILRETQDGLILAALLICRICLRDVVFLKAFLLESYSILLWLLI